MTNARGGKAAIICSRCSRSLLSEGPVRQSQGSPVPTCHITVSHIWGLSAFLARAASARSPGRRFAGDAFDVRAALGAKLAWLEAVRGNSSRLPSTPKITKPATENRSARSPCMRPRSVAITTTAPVAMIVRSLRQMTGT